jgi:hypothetical protein
MRRYIVLILLILTLIGAYTAYWFYALGEAKKGFDQAVAAERARGNDLTFATAEWNGFPIRIGVDLTAVTYRAGGLAFAADNMRMEVMPWNPGHALVRAEGKVRLAWRDQGTPEYHEAHPALLIASVRFSLAGTFQGADLELRNATVTGTRRDGTDYALRAARLQADTRFVTGSARGRETFDVAFSADKIDFPEPAPRLGNRLSAIRFAASVSDLPPFSKGWRPQDRETLINYLGESGTTAQIARLDFDWGQTKATGTGTLTLDAANRFKGQLDFKIVGIRQLIDALSANDVLNPGGVTIPDVPGGTPIALVLKDGVVTFGPFAISGLSPLD